MKQRSFRTMMLIFAAIGLASGCGTSTPQPSAPGEISSEIEFTDVTAESEIDFTYHNGAEAKTFSIAEVLGGGLGMLDYDCDGKTDLFLAGGGTIVPDDGLKGRSGGLFRNGNGLKYENVSKNAAVHRPGRYSHGVVVSDYNNDGFEDLLITGYGGLTLYRNQGDGTFTAVTERAGLADDQWSTAAAWGDVNGDGAVDLYVTHYVTWSLENNPKCFAREELRDVCSPTYFQGIGDTLYLSNGEGSFTDATETAGLVDGGKGLGVVMMDFDGDHDLDIYVANDTVDNFMYFNDGTGRLTERGTISGTAQDERGMPNGSMGVSVFDYNGDALPDLWVANFENDSWALYRNEGGTAFTHVSSAAGIFAIGSSYVGWGTITDDIDSDGDDDMIISNGHVLSYPKSGKTRQLPLVLRNQDERFELLKFAEDSYLGQRHHGRGLAKADIDNDGDWDLGFANLNEPFTLLRNDTDRQRDWIGLRLIGISCNRDAIGATVMLKTSEGMRTQYVAGGGSYLSHSCRRLLWTVPPETESMTFEIRWPSGQNQTLVVDEWNRYFNVVESSLL